MTAGGKRGICDARGHETPRGRKGGQMDFQDGLTRRGVLLGLGALGLAGLEGGAVGLLLGLDAGGVGGTSVASG